MKTGPITLVLCSLLPAAAAEPHISSFQRTGYLTITNVFASGACTIEHAVTLSSPWLPAKNVFTTSSVAQVAMVLDGDSGFYRAAAREFSPDRTGFTNLIQAYGKLTTIAGAGGIQDFNNWRPEFEGAPATNVLLSGPHITVANPAGEMFIADKDAHGIRKIRLDGTIVTVAGINQAGNGPDVETPATEVALNGPNGLWIHENGTLFILDTSNEKVRRLDTNGSLQTLFTVPEGISAGRGLWVSDDENLAFVSSLVTVKRWKRGEGVTDFSIGYLELGNLVMDPHGNLVVTDRGAHRVYRLDAVGNRTVIAGNGSIIGGGDGELALNTALQEVRAVWFLPTGGFFVATHRGSQVWYVDTAGYIHLLLNGARNIFPAGDGTWFYNTSQARVSEVRAVTLDHQGNLLITENDIGFVRKVEFLPFVQ